MFLFQSTLNDLGFDFENVFTFHYVSISMGYVEAGVAVAHIFTFHYVSISIFVVVHVVMV